MTPLSKVLAAVHEMQAQAAHMQRRARRLMAGRGRDAQPWMVDYAAEAERCWGWVMERTHDLMAQLERIRDEDGR